MSDVDMQQLDITPELRRIDAMMKNISMKRESSHFIAYIDMLGSKERIRYDHSVNTLHLIYSIFEQMNAVFNSEALIESNIQTKIFSDNIIIAMPEPDDEIPKLSLFDQFVGLIASFQYYSIVNAWPIRGGITIGNLYIDDMMVWGNGLIRAYELESNVAHYPRIVIDPKLNDLISKHHHIYPLCKMGEDALYSLDYLQICQTVGCVRMVRDGISKMPKPNNDSAAVKLSWLISKYNAFCNANGYNDLCLSNMVAEELA